MSGEQLTIGGDLTRHNGDRLIDWLASQPAISYVDLNELEIEDGVAAATAVNAVRLLCQRVEVLALAYAPQVLAHNLYRTGMLIEGGIELIAPREEEAYG